MDLTRAQRLAHILEPDRSMTSSQLAVATLLLGSALAIATVYSIRTLPGLDGSSGQLLHKIYIVAGLVFVFELGLRFWLQPQREAAPTARAWSSRGRYLLSGLGIVDVLSALPVLLILGGLSSYETIGALALVSLCKAARYIAGIDLLIQVVRNEAQALISVLTIVLILVFLSAALMYRFEQAAQPEVFNSLPSTLWWAVVTIATVGYGDMTPVTGPGRLLGGIIIILGVATFAMPAGILASGFASEMRRRSFLVTWQTVANVPLFADLSSTGISEITRLLKPESIPARRVVVRHGDPADAMYFIMSGEVEVEMTPQPIRLKKGKYFGEIALLKDIQRTATVITLTDCQFLVLTAVDFRELIDSNPRIKSRVANIAERRLEELEKGIH